MYVIQPTMGQYARLGLRAQSSPENSPNQSNQPKSRVPTVGRKMLAGYAYLYF